MLSADEEFALAKRWRQHQDQEAAHRLVASHLRLVAQVAGGFRAYGFPIGDLIAEGNVGMMRAVRGFDPDRGVRLVTYAIWWIRATIQEFILHNWSLVKIGTTAAQKKLFFKLRYTKRLIRAIDTGDLSAEQVTRIADLLDVPVEDVVAMNRRLTERDSSLNAPVATGEDHHQGEWQDWLIDDQPNQESKLGDYEVLTKRRQLLGQALATLSGRERHIFAERHLAEEPLTLEALSKTYGISRERVRQIEIGAYRKLQKRIKNTPDARDVLVTP